MTVWTHQLLDSLRQIGDPLLDAGAPGGGWRSVAQAQPPGDEPSPGALLRLWRRSEHGALPADVAPDDAYWSAGARVGHPRNTEVAQELFVRYGGEIGAALLLASLPHAYAADAGADVLATTRELQSNTRRRIAETAQLVVDVLFPDSTSVYAVAPAPGDVSGRALPPGTRGYLRVRSTRLTHAVIREVITTSTVGWDASAPMREPEVPGMPRRGVPINQEDLLGTLCTFTVTVFDVMERLGVPWSEEAEAAYLTHWDTIGDLLGIGTSEVTDQLAAAGVAVPPSHKGRLRPRTPTEARELELLIRSRCWPATSPGHQLGPFVNASGRVLVRALLDELQAAMPRGAERLPLVVMRYLVHREAHEVLGLGGGGLIDSLLSLPAGDHLVRRPARRRGRGVVERSMRAGAADISRRAFVHFIRERSDDPGQTDFWFPVVPAEVTMIPDGRRTGGR